jgi:hypothetical protein
MHAFFLREADRSWKGHDPRAAGEIDGRSHESASVRAGSISEARLAGT